MREAERYFERQIGKFERDMLDADRRGDAEAVTGLRKKMAYCREALRALKKIEKR